MLALEEDDAIGHQHGPEFLANRTEMFNRCVLGWTSGNVVRKVLVVEEILGDSEAETLNIENRLRVGRFLALFKGVV